MARGRWAAVVALVLLISAGCGFGRPRLGFPGTMGRQQSRAVAHDPYPDNQAGPDVVGVRPREYIEQLPEPERSQPQTPGWWPGSWFGP